MTASEEPAVTTFQGLCTRLLRDEAVEAGVDPFATPVSPADRLAMTELLVARIPGFTADATEIERPGLSFTVDTLAAISAAQPDTELVLLLGADAFALFDKWREPDRIRRLARVAVMARRGESVPAVDLTAGVQVLQTRRVDISSTELRARVAAGRTIRGFVPDAVADYIAERRLYL